MDNVVRVTEVPGQGFWPRNFLSGLKFVESLSRTIFATVKRGDKMMAVDITTEPSFRAGTPHLLFEGRYKFSPNGTSGYDVSPDGRRFLMIRSEVEAVPTQLNVVLNWFEELKQRVPVQ